MTSYRISEDVETVKLLRNWSTADLSRVTSIGTATLNRWITGDANPSRTKLEQFYNSVYSRGIDLNRIKAQLHTEDTHARGHVPLFHGAKERITEGLSLNRSRSNSDFGKGFYCGESLEQSTAFVAGFDNSCLYLVGFDPAGLTSRTFVVDQDWMLAIAWFRGWLNEYAGHPRLMQLKESLSRVDYVVAPIADNQMYELVGEFTSGYLTDVQCLHCLAATNLGNQYVFTSPKALSQVNLAECCYLCTNEKREALRARRRGSAVGLDKVKLAKRQFRNEGAYVEELLC